MAHLPLEVDLVPSAVRMSKSPFLTSPKFTVNGDEKQDPQGLTRIRSIITSLNTLQDFYTMLADLIHSRLREDVSFPLVLTEVNPPLF